MKKGLLSIILTIAMIITASVPTFAVNTNTLNQIRDNTILSTYSDYDLVQAVSASKNVETKSSLVENIISESTVKNVKVIGATKITSYETGLFLKYLPIGSTIVSVDKLGDNTYIKYNTSKQEEVILCYSKKGLLNKAIYDKSTDTAYFIDAEKLTGTVYNQFKKGSIIEMTQLQKDAVNKAIENGDLTQLNQIPGLSINSNGDSLIVNLKSNTQQNLAAAADKTNFVKPESQFVPYTKKVVLSQNMYSSYLKKNVPVSVKKTMNTYVQTKYDSRVFLAGTALTVIGLFVGGELTITVAILTGLGVLLSGADAIYQQASICKSSSYTYNGALEGYAYDQTAYMKDVKVVFNSSKGVLNGGLNSSGKFTWIDFTPSPAFSKSSSTIASTTIYNYNACLVLYGTCSLYAPD